MGTLRPAVEKQCPLCETWSGVDFPSKDIPVLVDDINLCIVRRVSAIEVELYPESHHER